MGYVNDIFDQATLATLPGHIAIGHTRYSTAGESKLLNAQPIVIDCQHGQVGVCHNGNIVNANEIRDRLVRDGSIFQTNSDTEVFVHLYARSTAGTVTEAVVDAMTKLVGAFSFAIITKDHLFAARDPHGFRPLALGRLGDAWVVCSETCALRSQSTRPTCAMWSRVNWWRSGPTAYDRSACFRRRGWRTACSSTSISRVLTAKCSDRASTRCVRISGACWPSRTPRKPMSWCRFPTRACAPRSVLPKRRSCRCGSA